MGFLQDLGGFLNEVKAVQDAVSEEFTETKQVIVSSVNDSAMQIQSTLTDTATSISATTSQISDDIKQSTTLPPTK